MARSSFLLFKRPSVKNYSKKIYYLKIWLPKERCYTVPKSIERVLKRASINEYFTPQTVKGILHSVQQAERGEMITFSMTELEAMEKGKIPKRAKDFMEANRKSG